MLALDDQQQAARDWFEALARPHLRRVRGDRARGRLRRRLRLHAVGAHRRQRRAGRRRRPRPDDRQGVREGRGQRLDRRRPASAPEFAKSDPRRRGRPELLRHRHQPRRAHGQPARPRGPHEHPLPDHDEALVRRRRRPQPGDPLRRGHRGLPRPPARRLRRPRPDLLSALFQMGRRIFLASPPRRRARRRRHLLRPSRRPFRRPFRLHPRRRRSVPRHLPAARPQADGHALHRRGHGAPARLPRPLRRVQPALRPRHPVRPQDRRQHRRHPDEPAAAGEVE